MKVVGGGNAVQTPVVTLGQWVTDQAVADPGARSVRTIRVPPTTVQNRQLNAKLTNTVLASSRLLHSLL